MTKICSRCGKELPVDAFRKYYNRRGSYTYCLTCERIESMRQYIKRKVAAGTATPKQLEDLAKIEELYKLRSDAGLKVPGMDSSTRQTSSQWLDDLLAETEATNG